MTQPTNPTDKWKDAVLDALAVTCMDAPLTESPDSILTRVIDWYVDLAKVESRTAALNEAIEICRENAQYYKDIAEGKFVTPHGKDLHTAMHHGAGNCAVEIERLNYQK